MTPETVAVLCAALEKGLPKYLAAAAAGIDQATINMWRDKGRRGVSEQYIETYKLIQAAEARAAERWLGYIDAAAAQPNSWQAAAWALERRFREDFGRVDTVKQTVDQTTTAITLEDWRKLRAGNRSRVDEMAEDFEDDVRDEFEGEEQTGGDESPDDVDVVDDD